MQWKLVDKAEFYETLVEMWKLHNFPIVTYNRLPNRIFVAYTEDLSVVLYAVPVYITDSTMVQIGFPTSNKLASKEVKKGVLVELIKIIEIVMKSQGYDLIYTTSSTPPIVEVLEKTGFDISDESVTYYTKTI